MVTNDRNTKEIFQPLSIGLREFSVSNDMVNDDDDNDKNFKSIDNDNDSSNSNNNSNNNIIK